MALSKPIVPVSTLDALRRLSRQGSRARSSRRGWTRIAGRSVCRRSTRLQARRRSHEATALPPLETLAAVAAVAAPAAAIRFIGDGAVRYARQHRRGAGRAGRRRPETSAASPARLAASRPPRRSVRSRPTRVAPLYVRRPDAELARDRRARHAPAPPVRDARASMSRDRRRLQAGDIDAVVALEAESFTNPWTRDMLDARARAAQTAARVYVLRLPGVPVAAFCVVLGDRRRTARQHHRRRSGAPPPRTGARAHACACITEVSAARVRSATLEVRRSNLAAQRLYERLGFAIAGLRPQLLLASRGRCADPVAPRAPMQAAGDGRRTSLKAFLAYRSRMRVPADGHLFSKEAKMPIDLEELKRKLLQTDDEFRQLATQHHSLDEQIHDTGHPPPLGTRTTRRSHPEKA